MKESEMKTMHLHTASASHDGFTEHLAVGESAADQVRCTYHAERLPVVRGNAKVKVLPLPSVLCAQIRPP